MVRQITWSLEALKTKKKSSIIELKEISQRLTAEN